MALAKAPAERAALRQRALPPGMDRLLQVAAGASSETLLEFAAQTGESDADIIEAARFYAREILFYQGADAYRVLGVEQDADTDTIRTHHRLLQQWLHPDRHSSDWDAIFASRVNAAWSRLRSDGRRQAYDHANPPQQRDETPLNLAYPAAFISPTVEGTSDDGDRWRRRAPVLALFAVCGVLSVLAIRDLQKEPVGLLGDAVEVDSALPAAASPSDSSVTLRIPDEAASGTSADREHAVALVPPVQLKSKPVSAPIAEAIAVKQVPKPITTAVAAKPVPSQIALANAPRPVSKPVLVSGAATPAQKPIAIGVAAKPVPKPIAIAVAPKPAQKPITIVVAPKTVPKPIASAVAAKPVPNPIAVAIASKPVSVSGTAKPAPKPIAVASKAVPQPITKAVAAKPVPKLIAVAIASKAVSKPVPVAAAAKPILKPVAATVAAKPLPQPVAVAVPVTPASKATSQQQVPPSKSEVLATSTGSSDTKSAKVASGAPAISQQRIQQAQKIGGQLMAYMSKSNAPVPPIWGSLATQKGAAQLRDSLQGSDSVKVTSPNWRVGDELASMRASVRYGDGHVGRLSAELVWREQRWLISGLSLERDL